MFRIVRVYDVCIGCVLLVVELVVHWSRDYAISIVSTGGLCALVPYFSFRVYVTSSRSSFGLNIESE